MNFQHKDYRCTGSLLVLACLCSSSSSRASHGPDLMSRAVWPETEPAWRCLYCFEEPT